MGDDQLLKACDLYAMTSRDQPEPDIPVEEPGCRLQAVGNLTKTIFNSQGALGAKRRNPELRTRTRMGDAVSASTTSTTIRMPPGGAAGVTSRVRSRVVV